MEETRCAPVGGEESQVLVVAETSQSDAVTRADKLLAKFEHQFRKSVEADAERKEELFPKSVVALCKSLLDSLPSSDSRRLLSRAKYLLPEVKFEIDFENLDAALTSDESKAVSDLLMAAMNEAKKKIPPPVRREKPKTMLKLKPLSPVERKIAVVFRNILSMAAVEYSTCQNSLHSVFVTMKTSLKSLLNSVESSSNKTENEGQAEDTAAAPNVDYKELVQNVLDAVEKQMTLFQEDEDVRDEFDEDLLHAIAIPVVEGLNTIEGFVCPPPPLDIFSEAHLTLKAKTREEKKAKRLGQLRQQQEKAELKAQDQLKKQEEKNKAKEALAKAKAEQKVQTKTGRSEAILVDEATVPNIQPLGYIQYRELPGLSDYEQHRKALFVWTVLVSLPETLKLTRFPFGIFCTMLLDMNKEQTIVQDICRGLVESIPRGEKFLSSRSPRTWFASVLEFVETLLEKKKFAEEEDSSSEDDSDDSSDDGSSSDSSSDESSEDSTGSSSESEGEGEEVQEQVEDEDGDTEEDPLRRAIREMVGEWKEVSPTNTLWINTGVSQRIDLLYFLVRCALGSKIVAETALTVALNSDTEWTAHEKDVKELQEECEKELRKLKNSKEDIDKEAKSEELKSKLKKQLTQSQVNFRKRFDQSVQLRIRPLGYDRYNRIYWRFPLEKEVFVQRLEGFTTDFPIEAPEAKDVVDEEDEDDILLAGRKTARNGRDETAEDGPVTKKQRLEASVPQKTWGRIPAGQLSAFIESLETLGRREGPLRTALLAWSPYLEKVSPPSDGKPPPGKMVTRSRQQNYGYTNAQRPPTMIPYF